MTIIFPREFPSGIKIAGNMFNLAPNQAIFKSSFTRDTQTQNHDAGKSDIWEGVYTTPPLTDADVATMDAFLTSLNGTENTFKAFHPDRRRAVNFVPTDFTFDSDEITFDSLLDTFDAEDFPGSALVSGGGQTGTSIASNSWNYFSQTVMVAGDMFQIENQLYRCLEDVNTNAFGDALINFRPPIRTSPVGGATIITKEPVMIARLSQQYDGTRTDQNKIGVISFAFEEI